MSRCSSHEHETRLSCIAVLYCPQRLVHFRTRWHTGLAEAVDPSLSDNFCNVVGNNRKVLTRSWRCVVGYGFWLIGSEKRGTISVCQSIGLGRLHWRLHFLRRGKILYPVSKAYTKWQPRHTRYVCKETPDQRRSHIVSSPVLLTRSSELLLITAQRRRCGWLQALSHATFEIRWSAKIIERRVITDSGDFLYQLYVTCFQQQTSKIRQ